MVRAQQIVSLCLEHHAEPEVDLTSPGKGAALRENFAKAVYCPARGTVQRGDTNQVLLGRGIIQRRRGNPLKITKHYTIEVCIKIDMH